MIVERFMHPGWLSNSYLVAARPGTDGIVIDTGADPAPLVARARELGVSVRWIVNTHFHVDHVENNEPVRASLGGEVAALGKDAEAIGRVDRVLAEGDLLAAGGLEARILHIPGHTSGHLALLVSATRDGVETGESTGDPVSHLFTGDTLFQGSIGGTVAPGHTTFDDIRRSIMGRLMEFPPETVVHPGHTGPTTVGREWDHNPFIRVMRGVDPEGTGRCEFSGRPARLIVWARDYDGGHKAWVRFEAEDATVPGSRVTLKGN
jgi:hydroxyacylglutathione hydrolase